VFALLPVEFFIFLVPAEAFWEWHGAVIACSLLFMGKMMMVYVAWSFAVTFFSGPKYLEISYIGRDRV